MKPLRFLVLLFTCSLLISCTTIPDKFPQRYFASNGGTTLILNADGSMEVEEIGEMNRIFPAGEWRATSRGVEFSSLGETLYLAVFKKGNAITLTAMNPEKCPQIMLTWKIAHRYELDLRNHD
jgi:hypothetical protein